MYLLKQIPEDFLVEEITNLNFEKSGRYSVFFLTKRSYATEDAIQTIATKFRIERKKIGYAGIKDRNAITKQYISIENAQNNLGETLLKDITLEFVGYLKEPITLGSLKGNKFNITIRNLQKTEMPKKNKVSINYFDKQRFSKNNVEIGKAILNKKFKEACDLITLGDGSYREIIDKHLAKSKNDYVNALKKIPRKILMIYVHAYQSKIWNETIQEHLKFKEDTINEEIPIVGFSTELQEGKLKSIITKIMNDENITFRDFIIREIPELSFEGNKRNIYAEIQNLTIEKQEQDELNEGMFKIKVEFFLEKGAYATMAIKQMFD
ncbi:hypothetical protein COV13_03215 [Candidatus Woesearchaeota archaeon CG10_big_fil_rev_8_21_14_0_10_32_9]|nr:MAG: hypothetical protein COV13_03215 [Candidatus Woesearchaeota archaeon CG10_big_fil_rev_8_21_14_0_10_32_9]